MKTVTRAWRTLLLVAAGTCAAATADGDDYGRAHIGGMKGPIMWESLLEGDGLGGWRAVHSDLEVWSREGDAIVARAGEREVGRLARGDDTWTSYELKVQAKMGGRSSSLEIHFGSNPEGTTFYSLNYLAGWKALAVSRFEKGKGVTKLDVVNFVMEGSREYDIVLAVRGHSVTSYVDGVLVNRLTLPANPKGGIELAVWGRHTEAWFRDPKVRHYN